MYGLASGMFWLENAEKRRMIQNKNIRNRFLLAVFLCGPFVWICVVAGAIGKCIGWFVDRSSVWIKGNEFLTHEDKIKIEKIKVLFKIR